MTTPPKPVSPTPVPAVPNAPQPRPVSTAEAFEVIRKRHARLLKKLSNA